MAAERFILEVRQHMIFQVALLHKPFTALFARIIPNAFRLKRRKQKHFFQNKIRLCGNASRRTAVNAFVRLQIRLRSEFLEANVAIVFVLHIVRQM